jgi:hypothetical protein
MSHSSIHIILILPILLRLKARWYSPHKKNFPCGKSLHPGQYLSFFSHAHSEVTVRTPFIEDMRAVSSHAIQSGSYAIFYFPFLEGSVSVIGGMVRGVGAALNAKDSLKLHPFVVIF